MATTSVIKGERGHKSKRKGIVINTIAMMEPRAEAAMADLAKRTGGQFTIINKDGKPRPGGRGK